jgi:hypothetical protein
VLIYETPRPATKKAAPAVRGWSDQVDGLRFIDGAGIRKHTAGYSLTSKRLAQIGTAAGQAALARRLRAALCGVARCGRAAAQVWLSRSRAAQVRITRARWRR